MRYTGTLRGSSLQWHNKSILSFSNSNSNIIKDNKPPKGSPRVTVCLGQVSAAQGPSSPQLPYRHSATWVEDPLFILAGPSEDPLFILAGPSHPLFILVGPSL